MSTFAEFRETFPDDNHARGKAFERFLADWFFKHHPLYSKKFSEVWLWEDWPKPDGISSQDLGTDLVAVDTEGKVCAIQAKFYDASRRVRFEDIATFLADTSKQHFDYRLLVATSELAPNARKQIVAQEKEVSTFLGHNFDEWEVSWPTNPADTTFQGSQTRFELLPHQVEAVKATCSDLKDRGQLIMACGTGKTFTGIRISEKLKADNTLVLLPSLLLLSKTLQDWLIHSSEPFKFLAVCSDASVVNRANDAVEFAVSELGCSTTTAAADIHEFLCSPGRKVIFATYQSSPQIAKAFEMGGLSPIDLVISDEAHRCAGKVDSAYSTILDESAIEAKKRLFMTATPKIFSAPSIAMAKSHNVHLASMDDHAVFGPVLHRLTFGEAIQRGLLSDYQVSIICLTDSAIKAEIDGKKLFELENESILDAAAVAAHFGLAKAINQFNLKSIISFHNRIRSAKDFAKHFPVVGARVLTESVDLSASYIDGAMPTAERNSRLSTLNASTQTSPRLITNARCLSEGVDVPALDCVAFIDPKSSEVDIVQAIGRAIRNSPGKDKGTIVIPVFIDREDDPEVALENSNFSHVWRVVRALRSHDEQLGDHLDALRVSLGKGNRIGAVSDKIHIDLPSSLTSDFQNKIQVALVESATAPWNFWFGLLEEYLRAHKGVHPERGVKIGDWRLGNWVHQQRVNKGVMSLEQITKLDSIGFVWDPLQHRFNKGLQGLREFKEKNGHLNVGKKSLFGDINLYTFSSRIRQRKKSQTLDQDQILSLEELGFSWDLLGDTWEKNFKALVHYHNINGHSNVPQDAEIDELKLGKWVRQQRDRLKKKQISPEQIARLDSLEFIWDAKEFGRKARLKLLEEFMSVHGHSRVPRGYMVNGIDLGEWVSGLRKRQHSLSEGLKLSLDTMNFEWDDYADAAWERGYEALKLYKDKFHSVSPSQKVKFEGFQLGVWVRRQRQSRKENNLSADKVHKLDHLGFVWNVQLEKDLAAIEVLKSYLKSTSQTSTSIPRNAVHNGFNLGTWVGTLKTRINRVDPIIKSQLDDLGFDWSSSKDAFWQERYEALQSFYKEHGHCHVKHKYRVGDIQLGVWVGTIRRFPGRLSQAQILKLNEIEFIWDLERWIWDRHFRELEKFYETNGHTRVPRTFEANKLKLGGWVRRQRDDFSALKEDQIQELVRLQFEFKG